MIFPSGDLPGKQTYPISWKTGAQRGDEFGGGFWHCIAMIQRSSKDF